jgi:hypothetical protein
VKNSNIADRLRLLERDNADLKRKNAELESELESLRLDPTLARGLKGETYIASLTGGDLTSYGDSYDVILTNGVQLEVKQCNKPYRPSSSITKRWNWYHVLGTSGRKEYDYLVLLGEKDPRYVDQYPADIPLVIFLIPRSAVNLLAVKGTQIAINTNLKTARAPKALELKRHLVMAVDEIKRLNDLPPKSQ